MNPKINSYTEFQPLKTLLVGGVYEDSFFDHIKNDTIREGLKEIISSTREDIDKLKEELINRDINVLQYTPKDLGFKDSIMDYIDDEGVIGKNTDLSRDGYRNGIPIPPISVRDDCIVMGQKLLVTDPTPYPTQLAIPKYKKLFGPENVDTRIEDESISFKRTEKNARKWCIKHGINPEDVEIDKIIEDQQLTQFCAPNLTRVGKTILVDVWQTPELVEKYLQPYWPEYDYKEIWIGGHNDSIYCVVRPGLVLATPWFEPYKDIFKGWDIIWFEDPDWDKTMSKQHKLKENNMGKYWYPEKKDNPELEYFINEWLSTWHGDASESVFDVNVLMLDENTAVINSESHVLMKELEKRKIEPVVIPLRNRFFWDGGWHCNTLDIYREGGMEDYGL